MRQEMLIWELSVNLPISLLDYELVWTLKIMKSKNILSGVRCGIQDGFGILKHPPPPLSSETFQGWNLRNREIETRFLD